MSDHLRIDQSGGVLHLRLDKPNKRNAIDDVMIAALIDAIDGAGRDETVRVIVLSGEGEHFCSGFDIVGRNESTKQRVGAIQRRLPSQSHRLIPLMATVQVPIVAAVRGWAAGVGLHLVAACDFAVVTDDAKLWEPFTERGFTPDSGATWLLPRLIGTARAREMLLLGRVVSGTEAADWGLVHRSVPASEHAAAVDAIVEQLAAAPTVAIGLTKWMLHASASAALEDQLRNEAFALELSSRSLDFREGLAAFLEKRSPKFEGK